MKKRARPRHDAKMKKARRMMTRDEIRRGVTPFNSKAWGLRGINRIVTEQKKAKAAETKKRYDRTTIESPGTVQRGIASRVPFLKGLVRK